MYLVPALNCFYWWKIVVCGTCVILGLEFASMSSGLQKKQSKKIAQRQESVVRKIKDSSLDKGFHLPEAAWPHETGDQFCVWASETRVTGCNHAF